MSKSCSREVKNACFKQFSSSYLQSLEVPLHTQARANLGSVGAAEVIRNLYLTTQAQVLAAEVLSYVVPELWLGDEYRVAGFSLSVAIECAVSLPPEIGEAVKLQTLYAKEVVAGPYGCQLHRNILVFLADGLVEHIQVQGVLVGGIVNEILYTDNITQMIPSVSLK